MDPVANRLRVLLIDDEDVVRQSLGSFLQRQGYQVLHGHSARHGLETLSDKGADIVLTDIRMPGMDGLALLRALRQDGNDVEVLLMTGHGDLDAAIEGLRYGAFDFFCKPLSLRALASSLRRTDHYRLIAAEVKRTERQLQAMQEGAVTAPAHGLLGESCQIQDVLRLVDKVARTSRSTVLIRGESGTGKGMVARAIHDASSRAARPFVTVECTSIPEPLLESELFGHEQGAFTGASGRKSGMFELAQGGTVFLDEIGDMSSGAQGKILRAIEDRCIRRVGGAREIGVDVRLIAATNRDLERAVIEDRFRADLLYRLNVFEIELPPLRSRREDVILLAHALLRQFAADMAKDVDGFDPCVLERLRDYRFPGNVRELRNIVERAVILCEGPTITRQDTAALFRPSSEDADASAAPRLEPHGNRTLAEVEAVAIRKALQQARGNQSEAARTLGIGRDALRYRMAKLELR